MTRSPRVTVVIATYNYGRYIGGAIESVLSQTFQDFELAIVDDGSADDTSQVVAPYLDDPRVSYIRTDHLGQPRAKNTGIQAGTGCYVAFLDADDLWQPTKLEKQVAVFERSGPEVAVVYCRRGWIDQDGTRFSPRPERPPQRGDVLATVFHRPFICFSSSMIRRDVLGEVGMFDESIPMSIDYDLWLRIALRYHFDYVDELLVLYRTGHANLSCRLVERNQCVRRIIKRFLDDPNGKKRIGRPLRSLVWAEHYCDTASAYGKKHLFKAFGWYLRALSSRPWHWPAWRALGLFWWPDSWRSLVLRTLRRPDLRQIKATPIDPTAASGLLDGPYTRSVGPSYIVTNQSKHTEAS